jgi:hypothetical protein
MRKLLSIFSLALLYIAVVYGQAAVDIPITVSDDAGSTSDIYFGLDLTATDGLDPALGELELPGFPPSGYAAAWLFPDFVTLSYNDYRAPGSPPAFPFTGTASWVIRLQNDVVNNPMTVSWDLPAGILPTSTITAGTQVLPFSGTGSITFDYNPAPGPSNLQFIFIDVVFENIGPATPEPAFEIAPPAPLIFPPTGVGLSNTEQVTVSNTGDADLEIFNVISTDGQFVVTPTSATITPGGNAIFDVTFTPAALGTFTADLEFDHNATNVSNPFLYQVQGVGADAGPTFSVAPTSLTFPTVNVGETFPRTLTVTNNGFLNTLNISLVSVTDPVNYSVSPTTATIAPGGNQVFTVTFAPTVAGPLAGEVVFTHNDPTPGTTTPVSVTGVGYIPPEVNGLVFEQDTAFVLEADFYPATMQLLGTPAGPDIQAIQFRLLTNMAGDDETILTFQNIVKGSDVSDPSWILDYNLVRGDLNANGASEDTIYVLLYNIEENNGLPTGVDHTELLIVNYRAADLPALVETAKSSFLIKEAEASTYNGFEIPITSSREELAVIVRNRVGSWGDVNGDGCLDILDLIMVVDHIVSRDSLDEEEFARANIAPWPIGATEPDPDEFVNVQDLSLIQNIILTGEFPDGTPVGTCGPPLPKFNGEPDAVVNIYINSEGISTYLESKIGIRGAQIEFGSVVDNPENMVINTPLGQGYYFRVDDLLRTLMYDRQAQKYIEAGNNFMADMPFVLSNPDDITLEKLILVDVNQRKVMNIEINLIHGSTSLPYDYVLWQNYPNPFNPNTAVRFQVPKTGDVTIKIYDMLGQEVRTLFASEVLRGTYTVNWDGLNDAGVQMSTGTYIYRMIAGEFVQSKKMVLLK